MEKLFVDRWFKLPPKEKMNKPLKIKKVYRKAVKNNAELCKKIKKQTSKKSG